MSAQERNTEPAKRNVTKDPTLDAMRAFDRNTKELSQDDKKTVLAMLNGESKVSATVVSAASKIDAFFKNVPKEQRSFVQGWCASKIKEAAAVRS